MLSSAVHNRSQTAAHLSPQGRLFSMWASARPPFRPALGESLRNFGVIYTETYRTASFFSLSLPPSPPFLDMPQWHHSLLPLCELRLLHPPLESIPTSFPLRFLHSCGLFGAATTKKTTHNPPHENSCRESCDLNNRSFIDTLYLDVDILPTEHWRRRGGRCLGMGGPKVFGSERKVDSFITFMSRHKVIFSRSLCGALVCASSDVLSS